MEEYLKPNTNNEQEPVAPIEAQNEVVEPTTPEAPKPEMTNEEVDTKFNEIVNTEFPAETSTNEFGNKVVEREVGDATTRTFESPEGEGAMSVMPKIDEERNVTRETYNPGEAPVEAPKPEDVHENNQ